MPKLFFVTGRELKRQLREPGMTLAMVLGALLFTLIVGLIFGSSGTFDRPLKVVVYDQDHSAASQSIISDLTNTQGLKVSAPGPDFPDPQEAIHDGKTAVAVAVPAGFEAGVRAGAGTTPAVTIYARKDGTDGLIVQEALGRSLTWLFTSQRAADLIAGRIAQTRPSSPDARATERAAVLQRLDAAWNQEPPVTTTVRQVGVKTESSAGFKGATQMVVTGFMVMFLMYPATFGAAGILEERRLGTWRRLLSTPTGGWTIILGKLLGIFISSFLQAIVIILVSRYAFGVNWGSSIPALLVMVTAFVLSTIGLGFALSGFTQTMAQLGAVAPVMITGSCMLGGAFWPSEFMPKFMQAIANFVPPTWAARGFNALVQRGLGLDGVVVPALVLLGFAAVFMAIGVARVRYE